MQGSVPQNAVHIASSVPAGLLGNVVDWKFLFPTYPHVINVIATQIVVKLRAAKLQTTFNQLDSHLLL